MQAYAGCLDFGMAGKCVGRSKLVLSHKDGTVGRVGTPFGTSRMQ